MKKLFKILTKLKTLLIQFKSHPIVVSKIILKYLLIRHLFRTLFQLLTIAIFGPAAFMEDPVHAVISIIY